MKRLIPAFIVLVITITLCFVSNFSSNIIVKDFKKEIDAFKDIKSENRKEIKYEINKIKNNWKYKEKYLAIFVNHKPIDGISININKLCDLSSFDNDLYLSYLSEIDFYLEMISKEQRITTESFY